ncbi:uncharacterized protein LOC111701407 [Eurytemora carolleeae]|uniref:uncharacterized protein LOC111701407 n=1 Tax=Eurytemora carolleeae TaxID=1294199 RepID=UPI000C7888D3|nr:uncharacterized protein LOC111701407 [Eurytemora carolleeae]|eukprot:XP_023328457.1 uncharacterized protein LOC111701407 [Eurytemora affinis]
MKLLLLTLFTLGVSGSEENDRKGKLFLVTSTTSTTVSTTTSILQTTTTCFAVTAARQACRKRRMILSNDPITNAEDTIEISRVERNVDDTVEVDNIESGTPKDGAKRDAKFFWYYMTTTTTSTSTSTSTSLSFTATYLITLSGCTPAGATFTVCG